jgi:hypothetical protein
LKLPTDLALAYSSRFSDRLPPEIQAKFVAVREGRKADLLTLEECRTVVRTLRIMILLQPDQAAKLEVNLKRFAALARVKRKRAREGKLPLQE